MFLTFDIYLKLYMQNFVIYVALIGILIHENIHVYREPTNNSLLSFRAD